MSSPARSIKFTDRDVREHTQQAREEVMRYLGQYFGEFQYLVDAKELLERHGIGRFTTAMLRGVLNCAWQDMHYGLRGPDDVGMSMVPSELESHIQKVDIAPPSSVRSERRVLQVPVRVKKQYYVSTHRSAKWTHIVRQDSAWGLYTRRTRLDGGDAVRLYVSSKCGRRLTDHADANLTNIPPSDFGLPVCPVCLAASS